MADDKNLEYRIAFNPVDKSTMFADAEAMKAVFEDLGKFFIETAKQGLDVHTSFINALKLAADQSGNLKDVLMLIKELNKDATKEIEPLIRYLEEAVKSGISFEDALKGVEVQAKFVKGHIKDWSDHFKDVYLSAKGLTREFEDGAKASVNFATSFIDGIIKVSEGMKMGEKTGGIMGSLMGGFSGLLTTIPTIVSSLNEMDKIVSKINKASYDTSAALGKQGEKAWVVDSVIKNLVGNYYMSSELSAKIAQNLALIGANSNEIYTVSDNIAKRYTMWSELTPEYQMKTMSDYAKNFGVSMSEADTVFGNVVNRAYALKNSIKDTAFDITNFINQTNQLTASTRQWGSGIEDAGKMLQVANMYVKEVTGGVDTIRAMEIAQTLMTTGLGNIGQMVYIAQTLGGSNLKGAGLFTQLGAMMTPGTKEADELGMSTEKRTGMNVDFIQNLGTDMLTKSEQKSGLAWAGFLGILQQQGLMGKTSSQALETLGQKFADVKGGKLNAEELSKALKEEQQKMEDAGINTAENTKEIKDKMTLLLNETTTYMTHTSKWIEGLFYKVVRGDDIVARRERYETEEKRREQVEATTHRAIGWQSKPSDIYSMTDAETIEMLIKYVPDNILKKILNTRYENEYRDFTKDNLFKKEELEYTSHIKRVTTPGILLNIIATAEEIQKEDVTSNIGTFDNSIPKVSITGRT